MVTRRKGWQPGEIGVEWGGGGEREGVETRKNAVEMGRNGDSHQ